MGEAKTTASSRVMIVGQHPVLRGTLRDIIEPEPDLEVIAEASDIEESVTAARALQPDVVVLDVVFAHRDSIAAICQACQPKDSTRVIIVGISADREHVIHSLRAGACGYLRTQDAEEELVLALRTASHGRPFLGAAVRQSDVLPETEASSEPTSLLVIEPDAVVAQSTRTALESADFHVQLAGDVEAALPLIKSMRPDGIILDVHLPDATREFRFVWEVRKHYDPRVRHTPILALLSFDRDASGAADADAAEAAQSYDYLPVQAFARKPVSPRQLVDRVRDLLAQRH